jgi:hypothetical protein
MELEIEIETFDKKLDFDLFEAKERFERGMETKIAEGVLARYERTDVCLAVGFADVIHFAITIGRNTAIGVVSGINISDWLYDKLKERKVEKLRIERTEVEIDRSQIERIITEKMETTN